MSDVLAEITALVGEVTGERDVTAASRFETLGNWGSMTALRLLALVEQKCTVTLDLRGYLAVETVRELAELVTAGGRF